MNLTNETHSKDKNLPPTKTRVIGIGASAGGLEALRQFFSHIPHKINASFVIIQHLSPDFKSLMNELLARYTKLPIETVAQNTPVMPNHIYLIPRNKNIVIKNGILRLTNRSPEVRLNLPIDIFFHSLGTDQTNNAIGIILSGSGTDGSRGVRTIKEAGGIVLAQDPNTAKFNGMPLATISIGLADNVLPPASLAETVIRITNDFDNNKLMRADKEPDFQNDFDKILSKVYHATSIDFQSYRKQTLVRRTQKRMQLNQFSEMKDYIDYMEKKPSEAKLLGKEFLIGVTRFFRDPEAFAILRDQVIPDIIKRRNPYETIRVWVAACSTGEEAYSIAILLMEAMMQNDLEPNFKIFATDVDEQAIKFASEGIYYDNIAGDVSNKRLELFFDLKIDKFKVKKKIRERIIFVRHDVLQDPPFINTDLVSCRNFLIYLGSEAQKKLLEVFHFSLDQGGYLYLGPSESIGTLKEFFQPINQKWNIFKNIHPTTKSSKRDSPNWPTRKLNQRASNSYMSNGEEKPPSSRENYLDFKRQEMVFNKILIKRHSPICLFLNQSLDILYINGDIGSLLHFPQALVRMNIEYLLDTKESLLFKSGVRQVAEKSQSVLYKDVPFHKDSELFHLDMHFSPIRMSQISTQVILVEIRIKDKLDGTESREILEINAETISEERIRTLEMEIRDTKEQKQSLIEELETTNEELQASNEELLASNEELQSTNEELQSVNEELYTVNTELQSKIEELTTVNNDVVNLLKSTEIATIFLDKYLRIRKFTNAIREQLDLVDGDIGRPITAFSHTLQDVDLAKLSKKVLINLNTIEQEVVDIHDNSFLMRILPYRTIDNVINGVVITFTNINEIKAANERIQRTSARHKAVFDNAIDNLSIYHKDGTFLDLNFTFPGYNKENIIGTNISEYIPPDNHVIQDAIEEMLATGQNKFYTLDLTLPTGDIVYLEAKVSPIIRNGEIEEFVITTRNFTEMKEKELKIIELNAELEERVEERTADLEEANERLEDLNAFLDDFVNGAIHDLRAPIMRLKSYVTVLTHPDEKTSEEKILNRMGIVSTRLESVLNGLIQYLDFQKNMGHAILNLNLKDVFYEVKSQFTDQLGRIPCTIKTNFHEAADFYYIKPYLNSVVYNLLDNALKYRSEDRHLEITVSTKEMKGYILFSLSDNGIGIDLNRYGHLLFKPFRKIANSREGSGIGLSILNNTIQRNGGRIEVESEVGKGSTFKVFIKPYLMSVTV